MFYVYLENEKNEVFYENNNGYVDFFSKITNEKLISKLIAKIKHMSS